MQRARLHFHHSLFQWWGVPSRYVQLVEHLNTYRYECTTRATPDVVDREGMPDWQTQAAALIEVTLRRQHTPWHNLNDLASEADTLELCHAGKVDIVHFLDGEHSGPYLPRLFQQSLRNVRSVATFHQPPSLAEELVHGPSLRLLDAIVLVSPAQLPFFARFVPRDRIHIFLHGVDTAFFTPRSGERDQGGLRCITTGLHLRDWDAFHAVASAVPEVGFTVVTSGRLALPQLPNVQVINGITDDELAQAYRSADVLFLPLKDSTANNSLLEGIASGLPVVSTNLESVRAYIPETAGFLIDGNSTKAFVEALRTLASDTDLRNRIAAASRNRAEQLSWARMVRQYEYLYDQLLAEPRPPVASAGTGPLPTIRERRSPAPTPRPAAASISPQGLPRGRFSSLAGWSVSLRDEGLTREADMLSNGMGTALPDDTDTLFALAAAAEAEWRWRDAIGYWDRFLAGCPENRRSAGLVRKARCQACIGAFSAVYRTLDTISAQFDGLECAAEIATAFGSGKAAAFAWRKCTTQYPDQIDGFLGLARHHLRQSNFVEADGLLSHVRQIWSESANAAALWARSADDRGDVALAESRWSQVLAAHADSDAILNPLARHYGVLADRTSCDVFVAEIDAGERFRAEFMLHFHRAGSAWDLAAVEASQLIRRLPADCTQRQRYAELLMRIGTPQALDEALETLRALRQLSPESIELVPPLARALIAVGLDEEAKSLVDGIPGERADSSAECLRIWQRLFDAKDGDGLRYWQAVFLAFGFGAAPPY